MASNSRSSIYLLLALIACALLILPYLIPQAGEVSREEEDVKYPAPAKKIRTQLESKPLEITPRGSVTTSADDNKRKLEEIEKLLQ